MAEINYRNEEVLLKVNGVTLYYKKSGEGTPVILLHGNGETHEIFDVLTQKLSRNFCVYAVDSRGHGKSSPVARLNYTDMAEDITTFIKELGLYKPLICGFSDGGITALIAAVNNSDILGGIIACGANINPSGLKLHLRVKYTFEYFRNRSDLLRLMLTQPHITRRELRKISVPVLITAGENDLIRKKHTLSIASNIKGCDIKIFSQEDHGSYVCGSDKLYDCLKRFAFRITPGTSK